MNMLNTLLNINWYTYINSWHNLPDLINVTIWIYTGKKLQKLECDLWSQNLIRSVERERSIGTIDTIGSINFIVPLNKENVFYERKLLVTKYWTLNWKCFVLFHGYLNLYIFMIEYLYETHFEIILFIKWRNYRKLK